MFNHSPSVILLDDVLEGFVDKGCSRNKDDIGNGLGNCSGHDDVILTGFVIEEFYHREFYHRRWKGFLWINMV